MARYCASIIGGQNLIFRPYIEVRTDTVKFKIPGFFSGDEQTVVINSITDIRISGTVLYGYSFTVLRKKLKTDERKNA